MSSKRISVELIINQLREAEVPLSQGQIRNNTLKQSVLLLEILQATGLVNLQPAVIAALCPTHLRGARLSAIILRVLAV